MAQEEIEVILTRQLASYLAAPVFLVDPHGNLLFYNEPAEQILGRRFEETGELPAEAWAHEFTPTGDDGRPLAPEDLPLIRALTERRPYGSTFWIVGHDGERRRILVNAFPLVGQSNRFLGAIAMFWEVSAS